MSDLVLAPTSGEDSGVRPDHRYRIQLHRLPPEDPTHEGQVVLDCEVGDRVQLIQLLATLLDDLVQEQETAGGEEDSRR